MSIVEKQPSMENQFHIYPLQSLCIFSSSPFTANSDITFYVCESLFIYIISNSIIWIFLELARQNEGIENPLY